MPRTVSGKLSVASVSLVLIGACLSNNPGQEESSEPGSSGASSGEEAGESTLGGIMTTTEEPESEGSGGAATTADETSTSSTGGTTETIPPLCGDGNKDADEECDNGDSNADDAACTLSCHAAKCGDNHIQAGVEACDDGTNDGAYNGCMPGCATLAPACGDLNVDAMYGEACDDDSPDMGCLRSCQRAESCKQLHDSWLDMAPSGIYKIFPKDIDVDAYCDMETDDGGYTFVKFSGINSLTAMAAEAKCGEIGLRLLVPRTEAHLAASFEVASDLDVTPLEGDAPMKPSSYLRIFGIYPVTPGTSCVGAPLNKETCPEWKASDGDAYWISDMALGMGQPSLDNCANCSMAYFWTGANLTAYTAFAGDGEGADSAQFMCEAGDKFGMNG